MGHDPAPIAGPAVPTNSEVVARFIAAFNEQDLDAFTDTLDPEVEIHSMKGLRKGIKETRAWATRKPGGVQQHLIVDELRESGDQVVALVRRRWHWEESGELASENVMAHVFGLRGGKVARWQPFEDRAEALRAAKIES